MQLLEGEAFYEPVAQAEIEDPVQLTRTVFQRLVLLGFRVEVVLEGGFCRIVECAAVVALEIGSNGKLSQVLSSDVKAGDSPRFESVGVVAPD